MPIGTIVKVRWESGVLDDDLFVVVGEINGRIGIKSVSEVRPLTHYVSLNQLTSA